jgi:hypothetical protein
MRRLGLTASSIAVCFAGVVVAAGCQPKPNPNHPQLRLNDIQVVATHNSYHVEPEPALMDALRGVIGDAADGFEYTHMPLDQELDRGVRQVELDAWVDAPEGGRYATPKVVSLLGLAPVDPRMSQTGLKVLHVLEVDYRSTCPTFVSCLQVIEAWSDAHPNHIPITIQIEPKDDVTPDPVGLGFVQPIPWTSSSFATLESEIGSVFPKGRIIRPADVQGHKPTLRQGVLADQWPTLRQARGKVLFALDDAGAKRDMYRSLRPDVADRLIFVNASPSDADAAYMVVNDPEQDAAQIKSLVAQGFIVRTRADADTVQARSGDTSERDAAWASGAQYVSTDYIVPDPRFTSYVGILPSGETIRCNPVSAPEGCRPDQLEG